MFKILKSCQKGIFGPVQGFQKFFSAAVHDLGIKIGRTLLHEKGVACNQYIMW